jgi:hypothetical protein
VVAPAQRQPSAPTTVPSRRRLIRAGFDFVTAGYPGPQMRVRTGTTQSTSVTADGVAGMDDGAGAVGEGCGSQQVMRPLASGERGAGPRPCGSSAGRGVGREGCRGKALPPTQEGAGHAQGCNACRGSNKVNARAARGKRGPQGSVHGGNRVKGGSRAHHKPRATPRHQQGSAAACGRRLTNGTARASGQRPTAARLLKAAATII